MKWIDIWYKINLSYNSIKDLLHKSDLGDNGLWIGIISWELD